MSKQTEMPKRRTWRMVLVGLAAVLSLALLAGGSTSVSAQETDVEYVAGAAATKIGDEMTVPITITSQTVDAGGVLATFTYDTASVEFVSCESPLELAVCNGDTAGEVKVAAVTGTEWADDTTVVNINLRGVAVDYDGLLGTSEETWIDNVDGAPITAAFDGAAPLVVMAGDVNCTQNLNIVDALMIAQYAVQNRTDTRSCPFGDTTRNINGAGADMDNNGSINIIDALIVSRCAVQIALEYCP